MEKIPIASDHGGISLKSRLVESNPEILLDLGSHEEGSVDFPDFAQKIAEYILSGKSNRGVLICTTGHGMGIAANRYRGIYATRCLTVSDAKHSRKHLNSNVLVLDQKSSIDDPMDIFVAWNKTKFSGEEKYIRRNKKLDKLPSRRFDD